MSRLNDLLRQLEQTNPAMAKELRLEYDAVADRRAFGLNFERHTPETVELPGRPVRRGDKVHVLPERGKNPTKANSRLWRLTEIDRVAEKATIESMEQRAAGAGSETQEQSLSDLVVVAEFRDPIYPGLVSTGRIERGGDKPFHTVINAENYHALQTLLFTHRGQIDCIYIDPPYNTGAKDWKYNNDYVEGEDLYRHSKWLAFMERRLVLAAELLNPDDSVLIVTIDQNEVARLSLLLEQVFPNARLEMVTSVINPRGKYRANDFARCEEYVFFLSLGNAAVLGEPDDDFGEGAAIAWRTFRRSDFSSRRGTAKGGTSQFFPVYVSSEGRIEEIGDPLAHGVPRDDAPRRDGCTAVFPMRDDGTEMNWGLTGPSARALLERGYLRVGRHTPSKPQAWELSYLTSGRIDDIAEGRAEVTGHNSDGSVIATYLSHKVKMPVTTWNRPSHNAETCGTELLKLLLGRKLFDFPKSLYAVEDAIRLFIADKPDAVVLDFFSGSGTTAHAVMRLNRLDGGRRRSIAITNNEVSADEQDRLRGELLRPGDAEWERRGICELVTKPRVAAAVLGCTPDGDRIGATYKFNDEFVIGEGLPENVEFLTLTYEAPLQVSTNRAFSKIAPLLWMRAGSEGRRIEDVSAGWDVADTYGVLANLDQCDAFLMEIAEREGAGTSIRMAFIVTDEDRLFSSVCKELPEHVEPVRLYEAYLRNFEIEAGRSAR